jgi:hypothetical protein
VTAFEQPSRGLPVGGCCPSDPGDEPELRKVRLGCVDALDEPEPPRACAYAVPLAVRGRSASWRTVTSVASTGDGGAAVFAEGHVRQSYAA